MPYKTDKVKIDDAILDRRIKLLPCQREMVHVMYARGAGIRAMARMYKVDKRLIQFILFPDRKKLNLKHREDRGGTKIYYNKEKHVDSMREHRRHKYDLLKDTI